MNIKLAKFIGEKLRPIELKLLVKWILNLKRKQIVLEDGRVYEIDPISDLGLKLTKDKLYEQEMTNLIESLLENNDSFIDLGANEGYFSVFAAKLVGAKGKVIAIEPQKRLWTVILNNLMLNNLENVQLLPYGIGSQRQELTLQLYPSTNSGATSFSKSFNFNLSFGWLRKKIFGSQLAKVITLDDLSFTIPSKIKLIKIDIEGFEFEAIKGAKKMLEQKRFIHLLIEIHHQALVGLNQDEKMIDDFLEAAGYAKKKVGHNLNLYTAQ